MTADRSVGPFNVNGTLTFPDPAVVLDLNHASETEAIESPADVPVVELEGIETSSSVIVSKSRTMPGA